jgi:hypothetical protein
MTPQDRKALAEQILTNPLTDLVLSEIERDAVERGVFAPATDHEARAAAMAEVRAIRAFRHHLTASLRDTAARKGAPA